MRRDPYYITGPAIISFSGGRTSAYMLWRIIQAHGGRLPDNVIVVFCNTGKERLETLDFVQRCASMWGVHVIWLEWRDTEVGFEVVSHNSASRNGEPFEGIIAKRQYLPNSVTRFCTIELKIRLIIKYAKSMGWTYWKSVIGLRFDELHRVFKQAARNAQRKEPFRAVAPMAKARTTKPDVLRFWLGENRSPKRLTHPLPQGFDLGLEDWEGNCDLCFLKGQKKRERIMRDNPELAQWWIDQEEKAKETATSGATFRDPSRPSYKHLFQIAVSQPMLPGMDEPPPEFEFDDETACGEGVCG